MSHIAKLSISVALILASVLSLSSTLLAQDRGGRARENQVGRLEDRAISRALERAQERAERIQEKAFVGADKESGSATRLLQRIQTSKQNSKQRSKDLKVLNDKYGLTLVVSNNKETLVRTGEIVAVNISSMGRAAAKRLMLKRIRTYELTGIGISVDVFGIDNNREIESILVELKQADPHGQYEFNVIYQTTGITSTNEHKTAAITLKDTPSSFTVGLVDTGVNVDHKSLQHLTVIQENFGRGKDIKPRNHGTAITSIIGRHGRASVYVADVFSGIAEFSDTEAVIKALDWLSKLDIGVINMSLAGPDDFILSLAVYRLTTKGHIIVAAVGNEGPDGPDRFPAAYKQVVGVTAVDTELNIYNKANQGSYVDIAAPGVAITASATRGEQNYSGTSFAAAFVSATLAPEHAKADPLKAAELLQQTMLALIDLGQVGHDPVFGHGLLNTKKYYPTGE